MTARSLGSILPRREKEWRTIKGGILVSFDAAVSSDPDNRVMRYEISAIREDDGKEAFKDTVYTEFYLAKSRMRNAYDHIVDGESLPAGVPCKYVVTAYDCYGRQCGKPLVSAPIALDSYQYDVN